MLLLSVLSFVVSLMAVLVVRRWFRRHAENYADDAPQRFHLGAVPRLGGIGMFLGWWGGVTAALALPHWGLYLGVQIDADQYAGVVSVAAVAMAIGVAEDVTQRVRVRWRLLLTALVGVMAVGLLNLSISRLGWVGIDAWWSLWPILGMGLAVLAIMGLAHAFNIIDGYNGLAASVAALIGLALTHVSLQVGDRALATLSLSLVASTLGFLFWNYPRGLIFAGDGGAYLWGVMWAVIAIMLVQRHPVVSPWFPFLLLLYPVWETLFSIYRKWSRGDSPGMADSLHLHQLVYRRLVRVVVHDQEVEQLLLSRNNRTTPYLLAFATLTVLPAVLFWNNTWVLIGFAVCFMVAYVAAYLMIVRFKVPGWLKR